MMSRILMVVILSSLLISCSTGSGGLEPINPPVVVAKTPTILTNFSDTTVVFGDTINIVGTVKDFTSLLINNEKADVINVALPTLIRETTVTINAINGSVSANKTVTTHVGNWTTSQFGILTHFKWGNGKYRLLNSKREFIRDMTFDGAKESLFFKDDWTQDFFLDGVYTASYKWTWSNKIIKIGSSTWELVTVDANHLVLISSVATNTNLFEETYTPI